MEERLLNEIARLALDKLGAQAARIWERGVELKTSSGSFRVEVKRL